MVKPLSSYAGQMKFLAVLCAAFVVPSAASQPVDSLLRFSFYNDVCVTIDVPKNAEPEHEWIIILYALPNGNSTAQTMGRKLAPGDDWHFDIQHIKAQTAYIRTELPEKNIAVVY